MTQVTSNQQPQPDTGVPSQPPTYLTSHKHFSEAHVRLGVTRLEPQQSRRGYHDDRQSREFRSQSAGAAASAVSPGAIDVVLTGPRWNGHERSESVRLITGRRWQSEAAGRDGDGQQSPHAGRAH